MDSSNYQSPLGSRYASVAMRENFSDQKKFRTWHRLWIALAESERELGLAISQEQIDELKAHEDHLDLALAARYEKELRHDVMAHIHAWGDVCPKARPILHLGATSCFVGDNTDLVLLRDGLQLIQSQVLTIVAQMAEFARRWRELPTLGYTHYQPAQATTVGKRACLWLQDLVHDLEDLEHAQSMIRFRGVKGTTGTQASFLELFGGDSEKVRELDRRVTAKMGFERSFGVTGQTYPRQLDFRVCQVLSSIAQSAHKFATDLRLLAHRRELEEPFGSQQIGSSAMPWKRNPMRSERICALARFVIETLGNTAHTAANQWLERTLDDSANRRLALAEIFLATDAVLNLYLDVSKGLVVYPAVIQRNLNAELPFLATEQLMMEAVQAGGDRQDLHERIRQHSHAAAAKIKEGGESDLRERLAGDPAFAQVAGRLDDLLDGARYVGRAPAQVLEFLSEEVDPVLDRYRDRLGVQGDVRV
ncbi:MAG: adenylosuccinate lyase [Planctomycetes bacterium]|nr:adenylosuccinate lyase [Planctomycetota bacterium]MCB9909022.1 adenylosuccinate lyase [Planctomycetota bacterium]MCB9911733.1 adenylosuccinate lyase [Planctomycetota bacterium]HPF15062.1 adenylosuccinate lyase [Planctomycetota bacterium]